jgi:putative ABC transport system permease protein
VSLFENLTLALEALLANKLRSLLTMLGIIIGVGSVVAIFAIGSGTERAVAGELEEALGGVIVLLPGAAGPGQESVRTEAFTDRDLQNIRTLLPDVKAVAPFFQVGGVSVSLGREKEIASLRGVDHDGLELESGKVKEGRWITQTEYEAGARVVVIGDGAADSLVGKGKSVVGKAVTIHGYPFTVIGVVEGQGGLLQGLGGGGIKEYFVPTPFVRRIMGDPPITQVLIKKRPGTNADQIMKDAIALVERSHRGAKFQGQSMEQIIQVLGSIMSIVTGVMMAVAGISLVVGGVGIMNIMLVSVTERTREIGIRKAIGASYRHILGQFIIEAIVLSLIGGGVGVLLAALPVWGVGRYLKVDMLISWEHIAIALGFSVLVGLLFGVYPASKAARLDPIEALRYE